MRALFIVGLGLLASSGVSAQCPDAARGCETQGLDFEHRDAFFDAFDYDSGWLPGGSPLQLRVTLHLAGETQIDLGAESQTFWDPPLTVQIPGVDESGRLFFDYGFEFRVYFRFDVTVAGVRFNVEEEIDIPSIPMDLLLMAEGFFDPFLFPPAEPFALEDATEAIPLVDGDLASLISLPGGVSGGFRLDVDASLRASYQTTELFIDALPPITFAGDSRRLTPRSVDGFGDAQDLVVHPEGVLHYLLRLGLHPIIFVEAAGRRFDLPLDPILLDLLDRETNVVFADEDVHVPLPNISVTPETLDFGTLVVGERSLMPLEVENTGESPLTIEFIVPANIEGIDGFTLAPRTRRIVEVGYRPARPGVLGGHVELRTNDPDAARLRISLSGEATGPTAMDAGVDAGPSMDVGVPFDAATMTPPGQGGVSGGCGCHLTSTPRTSPAPFLFAIAAVSLLRRRR